MPGLQVDEQRARDVALVVRLVEEDVLAVAALRGSRLSACSRDVVVRQRRRGCAMA